MQKPICKFTRGCVEPGHQQRNVTSQVKAQVFKEYGVLPKNRGLFVIDHLVPLELDGGNCLENLWPQPRTEAHLKDLDENELAAEVKSGAITIQQGQQKILEKWGTC